MDPEHPLALEQLAVVKLSQVKLSHNGRQVNVEFTPTTPACGMASIIGELTNFLYSTLL